MTTFTSKISIVRCLIASICLISILSFTSNTISPVLAKSNIRSIASNEPKNILQSPIINFNLIEYSIQDTKQDGLIDIQTPLPYFGEEVVFIPNGEGNNSVRIITGGEERIPIGPNALTVDEEGYIYILDTQGNKVIKVNKDGDIIAEVTYNDSIGALDIAVNSENLFLLNANNMSIYEIDSSGKELRKIEAPFYEQVSRINFTESGKLLITGIYEDANLSTDLEKIFIESSMIFDYAMEKQDLKTTTNANGIGTGKGIYSSTLLKTTLTEGVLSIDGQNESFALDVQSQNGWMLGSAELVNFDRFGNIFILITSISQSEEGVIQTNSQVAKYDSSGKYILAFNILNNSYTYPYKRITLDEEGNLYQLITDPKGAYIIRWTQTPSKEVININAFVSKIELNINNKENYSKDSCLTSLNEAAPVLSKTTTNATRESTITRDQVMSIANNFASHTWSVGSSNFAARTCNNCPVGPSHWAIGTPVTGVAYMWGGFDSVSDFDTKLSQGYLAGDVSGTTCTGSSCATGVDCSGFVSRAWGLSSKYSTRSLPDISTSINPNDLKKGDILDKSDSHVVLFSYFNGSGSPVYYESAYYSPNKVWLNTSGGWGYVDTYVPYRYNNITDGGTDTTPPTGGFNNPSEGANITSSTVRIDGWGQDNSGGSGFNYAHFTAEYNGSWHVISPDFTSSPFGFDWNLCSAGVPNGTVTLGLDVWDKSGNAAYSPGGVRHITKNYDCGSTTGTWHADYYDTIDRWWDWNNGNNFKCDENLSGPVLDKNYGTSGPCGMDGDTWIGEYAGTINFPTGNYVFILDHDDGMEFWINGTNVAHRQGSGSNDYVCPARNLSGNTNLKAMLREDGGDARIKVQWTTDTSVCKPSAPTLNSPANGQVFTEGQEINLSWSSTGDQYYGEIWGGPGGTLTFGYQPETSKNIGSQWPGYTYSWHVKAKNSSGESNWSDTRTFSVKPKSPTSLSATASSCTAVNLSWTDQSGSEDGFKVYRNGSYIGGAGSGVTNFTDTGATQSTAYQYVVKAYKGSIESDASNTASVTTPACPVIPIPPTNVTASDGTCTDKVRVSWNTSANATYYEVYRSTSTSSSGSTKLGSPSASPYDDTGAIPGTTYFYFLKACNGAGCSGYSTGDSGYRGLDVPPTPGNFRVTGTTSSSITIAWDDVSGETGYKIYRWGWVDGIWDFYYYATLGANTISFTNSSLDCGGSQYFYQVSAYNAIGESSRADWVVGATTACPIPSNPTEVNASDGTYSDKVLVNWTGSSGATYYEVYGNMTSSSSGSVLLGSPSASPYDDTGASVGITYYYFVKACNSSGCSGYSVGDSGYRAQTDTENPVVNWIDPVGNTGVYDVIGLPVTLTVSATDNVGVAYVQFWRWDYVNEEYLSIGIDDTSPYSLVFDSSELLPGWNYITAEAYDFSDNYDYEYIYLNRVELTPPTNVAASDGSYTNMVLVNWSSSDGATYYDIFRNTSNDSSTATYLSSPIGTMWDDTSAVPGTTYWYFVKACNSTVCSNFSTADSGYRASSSLIPKPSKPGGTIYDRTPTYKWTKVANATKYQYQLYLGTTLVYTKYPVNPICDATYCKHTPTYTLGFKSYKWRVRAYVGGSWKPWSVYKTFTIARSATNE